MNSLSAHIDQGSLVDSIFTDGLPEGQMVSRVILTDDIYTSLTIKQQILQRQVGDVRTYFAADHATVQDYPDEVNNYLREFLHIVTPSWTTTTPPHTPPHTLEVKFGCIFMLLRSLDPRNNLCNDT